MHDGAYVVGCQVGGGNSVEVFLYGCSNVPPVDADVLISIRTHVFVKEPYHVTKLVNKGALLQITNNKHELLLLNRHIHINPLTLVVFEDHRMRNRLQ